MKVEDYRGGEIWFHGSQYIAYLQDKQLGKRNTKGGARILINRAKRGGDVGGIS